MGFIVLVVFFIRYVCYRLMLLIFIILFRVNYDALMFRIDALGCFGLLIAFFGMILCTITRNLICVNNHMNALVILFVMISFILILKIRFLYDGSFSSHISLDSNAVIMII